MYARFRKSALHWVIWEITTIRDQDVFSGQWNGSDYYNLSEYKYNDSFWGFNEIWMQYYNIIKNANSAIEALEAMLSTAPQKLNKRPTVPILVR